MLATPSHREGPSAGAIYTLGFQNLRQRRISTAMDVFRSLILLFPSDERGWLGLGLCHERVGHPDLAREVYGTGSLIAIHPQRCQKAHKRLLPAELLN